MRDTKNVLIFLLTLAVVGLGIEDFVLHRMIERIDKGYLAFMSKPYHGKPLVDSLKPGTLGVFVQKDKDTVCGQLERH